MNNRGEVFEQKACEYLQNNDFKVIERNFHSRFGEIDVIAIKGDVLHFIEVKGRINPLYHPSYAVHRKKQQKIVSTAKFFLLRNKQLNDMYQQFDVISVVLEPEKIDFIENCFF